MAPDKFRIAPLESPVRITLRINLKEKKMAVERSYDAIIIGAGQGAKPLSMVLAKAGMKTALVEEGYVGGACVNYG